MRFRGFLLFWLFVGKSKFKSGFETDRGGKSILWTKVCGILPLHIAGGGVLFFYSRRNIDGTTVQRSVLLVRNRGLWYNKKE